MATKKQLKSLLKIQKREDIKSLVVLYRFIDDSQQCAQLSINGITVTYEFRWADDLDFLSYWDESDRAFNDLKQQIECMVELAENG